MQSIKVIGFDADDTLWVNEPYFRDVEKQFCQIMEPYMVETESAKELFITEIKNIEIYGYGVKGFVLSMIETAIRISGGKITSFEIGSIMDIGKSLLTIPIELLEGVENVLVQLQGKYKLVLITKGDLLDQEQKLQKSGLIEYFHHIEIMSEKHENNYKKLLAHLDIQPHEFLMVGNSIKSDILPVINIGSKAIHIPFHTTWAHENNHDTPIVDSFLNVLVISDILNLL